MKSIRVIRIIARMNVAGPAVQVSGLMRELHEPEFEQLLVTGYCADDEADYLDTQARDVESLRIDGLGRAVNATDDARALTKLIHIMRDFRPDVVHTHTAKAGVLGRVAAKLSGTRPKIVHTYHGHLLHGYFSPAKTRAVIALERSLARLSDRLVAVGPQVRDDLLAAGIGRPGQYAVVAPGLVLPPTVSRPEARRLLGLDDQPVIAFIGRLTGIKRPDRFVEVVQQVHERGSNVTFLVAGAGDKAAELEQAVEEAGLPVKVLGWRDDIEVILAASDAVILTSDNEGTPISLIQAAMAGLPVIATDVGSVKDVVVHNETGWLTPPTASALAARVESWANLPDRGASLGAAARARANNLYGVTRLASDYAQIYRTLA